MLCDIVVELTALLLESYEGVVVEGSLMHDINVEGKRLEKWNSILTAHFLQHDSELVVGDLTDEVALELNNNVISGKDWAESVALLAEEAEAIAFADEWVVEAGFHARLRRHNCEVFHVLETLVADLNCESEGLCLRVYISWSYLLKLNLGIKLLDSLLNYRVGLV